MDADNKTTDLHWTALHLQSSRPAFSCTLGAAALTNTDQYSLQRIQSIYFLLHKRAHC